MKSIFNQWSWFSRLLFMMVALGGLPVVVLAVLILFMPTHLSIEEYRQILGVFMMTIPVISLCLAGVASRSVKTSYQKILMAQKQFKSGNFSARICSLTDKDTKLIFNGFNSMAEVVEAVFEKMVQHEKDRVLARQALQVAHDIQSPLSSLRTASLLLQSTDVSSETEFKDGINLLQLAQKRLVSIADGLLNRDVKRSIVNEDYSVHEILDELVGEFKSSELGRGVEFKKSYWTKAVYVAGNRTNLQRALGNVIKNALEAMQSKQDNRMLYISTSLNDADKIVIGIKDTGVGIEEEKLSHVLAGGYTAGKQDGHGIGTQVLKEVIAAHQGEIRINSKVGKGTEFLISLPIRTHTSNGSEHVFELPYKSGTPITVIDDEPSIREQWRILLRSLAPVFKSYSCWEEFVAETKGQHPGGTIIVDYHFDNSEVDGFEILRRLQSSGKGKYVLATAEYWKPIIKSAADKMGIVLCPKPLPMIKLSGDLLENSSNIKSENFYDIMVVDDDDAILLSWKTMKKHLNIDRLDCFKCYEDVMNSGVDPSVYDACFIDKNVEGSQYGVAEMLSALKEKGAKWVVLASGEQLSSVAEDVQLSKIDMVSKEKVPISLEPLLMDKN